PAFGSPYGSGRQWLPGGLSPVRSFSKSRPIYFFDTIGAKNESRPNALVCLDCGIHRRARDNFFPGARDDSRSVASLRRRLESFRVFLRTSGTSSDSAIQIGIPPFDRKPDWLRRGPIANTSYSFSI